MGNRIIEINGKRYDAQSGTLLGESTRVALAAKKPALRRHSRVVDGFAPAKKPNASINQSNHVQVQKQLAKAPATTKSQSVILRADIQRAKPQPSKAATFHKPEKAKTLMRHSVHKPAVAKKAIKLQAVKEVPAKDVAVATPSLKLAAHHVDKQRLMRSRTHRQSNQVQRFTTSQQNHPKQLTAPTSVVKADLAAPVVVAQPAAQGNAVRSAQRSRAAMYQPQRRQAAPARVAPAHAQSSAHVATAKPDDIFEAAIANARSHEQPAPKLKRKARNRFAQAGAFLAAFVAIAGFVAYLNMPGIELRIASSKAGFSAALPAFRPNGYAMEGGIQADHGVVRVSFRSGASSYTLQQQESSWDSQTLLDNVVAIEDASYKVYESQGRTVYVYGDKAAWVNGGVLYSMKINGDISKNDIISIATSV